MNLESLIYDKNIGCKYIITAKECLMRHKGPYAPFIKRFFFQFQNLKYNALLGKDLPTLTVTQKNHTPEYGNSWHIRLKGNVSACDKNEIKSKRFVVLHNNSYLWFLFRSDTRQNYKSTFAGISQNKLKTFIKN